MARARWYVARMDHEWAIAVLQRWMTGVRDVAPRGSWVRDSDEVQALLLWEHQTRRVLQRVEGTPELPDLVSQSRVEGFYFEHGMERIRYALGRLITDQETDEKLGSSAPQMSADDLHPIVWEAASALWDDEHHAQAVQRAATFLNAHIQDRAQRRDVSEGQLMIQAFSLNPPETGKPRLRWPGDDNDLTVKAMRTGILNYSQGCYAAIRNPTTHGTAERTRQEYLEQLAALSMLARWVDECELVQLPDPWDA
jgi:hypothetical protein